MDDPSDLQASRNPSRAIGAGAAYAAVVFAFAFMTGIARMLAVGLGAPRLPSVIIELPIILYFAWRTCRPMMKWMQVSPDTGVRVLTGISALIVMLGAEYGLSALVIGRTLPDFLATYATPEAMLGLAGQVVFATFPLFRWRAF